LIREGRMDEGREGEVWIGEWREKKGRREGGRTDRWMEELSQAQGWPSSPEVDMQALTSVISGKPGGLVV
jgi:hypothetical protein